MGYTISSVDGPVPGVGWEGCREGIDDYRYLQLLEARLAATADPNPLKDTAQVWLDDLKSTVLTSINNGVLSDRHLVGDLHSYDWHDPDPDHSPDQYRGIRETVATYIGQFTPAPGELNPSTVPTSYPLSSGWEGTDYESSPIGECITALQRGTTSEKRAAATALSIRSNGAAALDALSDLVDDPDVRIPALAAIGQLKAAAAPANQTVTQFLQNTDGFVRLACTRVLEASGVMKPEWFLDALSDPFPMLPGVLVEHLWPRGNIDQTAILNVMNDSIRWKFAYEADVLLTDDGWTLLSSNLYSFVPPEPSAVMLPARSPPYQILELNSLSGFQNRYEKTWTLLSGNFSFESRIKLRKPNLCADPQILLRARNVTESSLRPTGSPGAISVV